MQKLINGEGIFKYIKPQKLNVGEILNRIEEIKMVKKITNGTLILSKKGNLFD